MTNSRLENSSIKIRTALETRNLYTPDNPYQLNNPKIVNAINALVNIIQPFGAFDLTNTVVGRMVGPNTPLAQIGIKMLAKQFAQTAASLGSAEYLPSIKFQNLFDGDPSTKFIMRKIDFQITQRASQSNVARIVDNLTGYYPLINPFKTNPTIGDYIKNSGKGQLQILYQNINKNPFKLNTSDFISASQSMGFKLQRGSISEFNKYNSIGGNFVSGYNRMFFIGIDDNFYPFDQYKSGKGITLANSDYKESLTTFLDDSTVNKLGINQYGATQEFLDQYGKTIIRNNNDGAANYSIDSNNYGLDDSSNNQLVWGRDGVSKPYTDESGAIENPFEGITHINPRFNNTDNFIRLGIKGGLLDYTRQLLNSKGKYGSFDQVRKKFISIDEQVHFNGSPIDTHPDTNEIDLSRRHSVADPYDRYVKAIRFNGNVMYDGSPDSVIHRSVMPKIHPVNNGFIDISNMMFSIENLAIKVIKNKDEVTATLDDPYSTIVPVCEAGNGGGRLMWFPPYDVRLSEQAIARYETTQFIGRGEPVYTYSTSERLATLSFKLLIDYPQQLINYRGKDNFQKTAAEFFAFGGQGKPPDIPNISELENQKQKLIEQRDSIHPTKQLINPQLPFGKELSFFFPNDVPAKGTESTSVSNIIINGYEIDSITEPYPNSHLNIDFYEAIYDQIKLFLDINTNASLSNDENKYANINFVNLEIIGSATLLYHNTKDQAQYNKDLSQRRIDAMKAYIEQRFKSIFNTEKAPTDFEGFKYITYAQGSSQSSSENGTVATINSLGAKEERAVKIRFSSNGNIQTKTVGITNEDKNNIKILNDQIIAIQTLIDSTKRRLSGYSPCIFNLPQVEDGIPKGFRSINDNIFYPVFHSQTSEDFHRRLTFLHQCTRQGTAIRKARDEGSLSANNSVFGRQPVCIFRYGDFFHTKIIIDNISFQYEESPWDLNPEGMGMQPMIADITIQMKVIGGQSLKAPIDALQNAATFNYYANSTYSNSDLYKTPKNMESMQVAYNKDIKTKQTQQALNNLVEENMNF